MGGTSIIKGTNQYINSLNENIKDQLASRDEPGSLDELISPSQFESTTGQKNVEKKGTTISISISIPKTIPPVTLHFRSQKQN